MPERHMIISVIAALMVFASPVWFARSAAYGEDTGRSGKDSHEDLAKASQNPVSDLISLPFQNNTSFNFGPEEKTQNILNIQPVNGAGRTLRVQLQLLFPK